LATDPTTTPEAALRKEIRCRGGRILTGATCCVIVSIVLAACGTDGSGPVQPAVGNPLEIYVTDSLTSAIHIFSLDSADFVGRIDVVGEPQSLAIAPDQRTLYVALDDPDALGIISLRDRRLSRTISAEGSGLGLAAHPTRGEVYRVNQSGGSVTVFDVRANVVRAEVPVGRSPQYAALTPDGSHLLVPLFFDGKVARMNVETLTVDTIAHLTWTAGGPAGIAMSAPDAFYVGWFVSDGRPAPVWKLSYPSGAVQEREVLPGPSIQISAGGRYVLSSSEGHLLDAGTLEPISIFGVPAWAAVLSPDGSTAALATAGNRRSPERRVGVFMTPDSTVANLTIEGGGLVAAIEMNRWRHRTSDPPPG